MQFRQSDSITLPDALEKVPEGHEVGVGEPWTQYLPGGQMVSGGFGITSPPEQ